MIVSPAWNAAKMQVFLTELGALRLQIWKDIFMDDPPLSPPSLIQICPGGITPLCDVRRTSLVSLRKVFCVILYLIQRLMDNYLSLVPRSLQDFIHTAVEKNWEKAWDHCYVMSRKWWTGLVTSPPFLVCDVAMFPGLLPIFLHGCEIKSGSVLGTRLQVPVVLFQELENLPRKVWNIH